MSDFTQLAIIGPTASGKTALAVNVARKHDAHILSLDSLSIYKEIDIVSAKPTIEERQGVKHFGIDHLYPDEPFDVKTYIDLYSDVKRYCQDENKNLVIVGGTSFYLKMLIEGVSPMPKLSYDQTKQIKQRMLSPTQVYDDMYKADPAYMKDIKKGDTYRIEKALEIYISSGIIPSVYFDTHPPKPVIEESLPVYEIVWDRSSLRERIRQRTEAMIEQGLIDEIIALEKKYTRAPNCMKAIGIKETLMYLDGIYDKKMLIEKITINTGRLAKRQVTFNNSQFENVVKGSLEDLKKKLL